MNLPENLLPPRGLSCLPTTQVVHSAYFPRRSDLVFRFGEKDFIQYFVLGEASPRRHVEGTFVNVENDCVLLLASNFTLFIFPAERDRIRRFVV